MLRHCEPFILKLISVTSPQIQMLEVLKKNHNGPPKVHQYLCLVFIFLFVVCLSFCGFRFFCGAFVKLQN